MDHPLKIAHCVESYTPALGGMAEVVRQLSERMTAHGHEVVIFTSAHADRPGNAVNGVPIRSFPLSGNTIAGITGDPAPYLQELRTGGFDVVTLFAAQQWSADLVLPVLDSIPAKKVFVPTGFSALHDPGWRYYFEQMPQWLAAMDLNVFHSETYQDMAFAREHGITNLAVIPNGAAEEEFDGPPGLDVRKELGLAADQPMILHIGSYSGLKGHREAIRMFLRADTGSAVLVLVGNGVKILEGYYKAHRSYFTLRWQARLRGKKILFLELDRKRTVATLKSSDLFLFPSNIECSPIVLYEAAAAGVPFLASQAGNSEEIARWTGGGWVIPGTRNDQRRIVPDISAGARQLSEIISDTALLRNTGRKGNQAWKERFTWKKIADRYLNAYLQLAGREQ